MLFYLVYLFLFGTESQENLDRQAAEFLPAFNGIHDEAQWLHLGISFPEVYVLEE